MARYTSGIRTENNTVRPRSLICTSDIQFPHLPPYWN